MWVLNMCEFCFKHGTGKYWYKEARFYARQMYHRQRTERKPAGAGGGKLEAQVGAMILEAIQAKNLKPEKYPEMISKVNRLVKDVHTGQVVTLDDALTMIDLASPIAFIACDCRRQKYGYVERDRSKMTCLGLGIGMFRWEQFPSRYIAGAEFVDDKEAKEWIKRWDDEGMVHTLMTFGTREGAPYIGGLCNCSCADCLSIRFRLDFGIHQLMKGERVAKLANPEACKGCYGCVSRCQFGAITADVRQNRPYIDMMKCFGCGQCLAACNYNVIALDDRRNYEVLKHVW